MLQLIDEIPHRSTTIELKHEGNVLDYEPSRSTVRVVDQAKNVLNQTRLASTNSGGPTSLTQVLTRETGSQNIYSW
jgi:hypothetical protein